LGDEAVPYFFPEMEQIDQCFGQLNSIFNRIPKLFEGRGATKFVSDLGQLRNKVVGQI